MSLPCGEQALAWGPGDLRCPTSVCCGTCHQLVVSFPPHVMSAVFSICLLYFSSSSSYSPSCLTMLLSIPTPVHPLALIPTVVHHTHTRLSCLSPRSPLAIDFPFSRHVHLLYEPDCCTSGFHSNSIVSCTDRLHITFNLDMLWISSIIFAILSILDNSPSSSLHVRHLSTAVFVTGHCCWQHWVIVSLGSGLTSPVCLNS